MATTWDPTSATNTTLSNGNLTVSNAATVTNNQGVRVASSLGKTSGKYYYEITYNSLNSGNNYNGGPCVGLTTATYLDLVGNGGVSTGGTNGVILFVNGLIYANGINTGVFLQSISHAGDIIAVAVDLDHFQIWFKVISGPDFDPTAGWNFSNVDANPATNTGGVTIPSGIIVPFFCFGNDDSIGVDTVTANFGASTFTGIIPSGFTTWPIGGVNVAQNPDLDKGGTFRQYMKVWMGPSVGWLSMPFETVFPITVAGTYTLERWTNLVQINVAGNITINLPSSKASTKGPQAIPGQWVLNPVTIVDIGGHSASFTYTIVPNGAELISGLSSVTLAANFGSIILEPLLDTGGWNLIQ